MSKKYKHDYTGRKYGKLTVVRFAPTPGYDSMWLCFCDCGNETTVWAQALRRGGTRSCGCLLKETMAEKWPCQSGRGLRKRTGAYSSWANMMARCDWMSQPSSEFYGKKGILVDTRWHVFENFYADMGDRPPKHSIDRIDGTKGYGPENCRWATQREQHINRINTIFVRCNGEDVPAITLSERLGLNYSAIQLRAWRRGNDYVKAFLSAGVDVDYPIGKPKRHQESMAG